MVSEATRKKYKVTIGIECHVQLKTATKLFSGVGNDAREAPPNSLISHICLGMPGALPVLNEKAVELACRMAFALNTEPQQHSIFERKHYFYPDLPKGYQITQLSEPIIKGGDVEIEVDGTKHRVKINRVQIEEDAGKNTHPAGKDYSLVDLNRAGTPLLEIVSEPDIYSAAQAKAYVRELYLLVRYADVSDADLFHGNMRFDVNVSVSPTTKLGTRTETKNLNSFRSVEKTVEFEVTRQIELLEKGEGIVQETRGWDDAKQKTFSQRGKEEAHDYRYMPEPDLPPVDLDNSYIQNISKAMPVMPSELRTKLSGLGLDHSAINVLIGSPSDALAVLSIMTSDGKEHAKRVANWIINTFDPELEVGQEAAFDNNEAVKLSKMVQDAEISATAAKEVWLELKRNGGDARAIAKERNLLQLSDESELKRIVIDVIQANPQAAEDIKKGELKAIGFLVGQVMKQSQGKANPQVVQNLIKLRLR